MFNVGDSVVCTYDLSYQTGKCVSVVKSGYTLIVKQVIEDNIVLDRYGKLFVVKKEFVIKK